MIYQVLQFELANDVLGGCRFNKHFLLRAVVEKTDGHKTPLGQLPFGQNTNHFLKTPLLIAVQQSLEAVARAGPIIPPKTIHVVPKFRLRAIS